MTTKRDILAYTQSILEELSRFISLKKSEVVCLANEADGGTEHALIVAESGELAHYPHQRLWHVMHERALMQFIFEACRQKQYVRIIGYSIVFLKIKS